MTVGTLGCFVRLDNSAIGFLSNNHVIGGENRGRKGDRILHPGGNNFAPEDKIGELYNFVPLQFSVSGAMPASGAVLNETDAAVGTLDTGIYYEQKHLTYQSKPVSGVGTALDGDLVYKVGRTTGPAVGEISSTAAIVGPVPYDGGQCWFRRSIEIIGYAGARFTGPGDLGAGIVNIRTNNIVGLLYGGTSQLTYACPIDQVFNDLSCACV